LNDAVHQKDLPHNDPAQTKNAQTKNETPHER
jgi:hypothetical protein